MAEEKQEKEHAFIDIDMGISMLLAQAKVKPEDLTERERKLIHGAFSLATGGTAMYICQTLGAQQIIIQKHPLKMMQMVGNIEEHMLQFKKDFDLK